MNATTFLTEDERRAIEQTIAEIEKKTSAEIVCALATESGRYDRAESVVGLAGALVGLGAAQWAASGSVPVESGAWLVQRSLPLMELSLAVVIGFVAGSTVASLWHGLRRLFTARQEMTDETERAADHVFVARRLSSTRERGGLLLYVSLAERMVVVRGDEGLLKVAGQAFLDELRDRAVRRLHEGKRVEAFSDVLLAAGEKLSRLLPRREDDADELENRLLIFPSRP